MFTDLMWKKCDQYIPNYHITISAVLRIVHLT